MLNPQNKLYRWGPISACPLFMYFTIETAFVPLKKLFGITYTESLIIFKDKKVTWLLDDKELGKQSQQFVNKVILNNNKSKKYFGLWDKRSKKIFKLFSYLNKLNYSLLSDKSLVGEFKKFSRVYSDWFIVTISLELAASSLEPLLGDKLNKYYGESKQKDYQKDFSTLTAPLSLTFYRQEQKDILKILTFPKEKQTKALENHQKKYYWIFNSYAGGQVMDLNYFKKELSKYAKSDFQKILTEIEEYPLTIKKDKEEIFKKIRINREDKSIASTVETFSRLLNERKMINFKAEHYLELFVQEIAKRTGVSIENLRHLLPEELSKSFEFVDNKLIKKRKECFVLSCTDKKIKHFVGGNANILASQFLGIKNINENIIHGQVASVGESHYFRGVAKIVLTINQIDKINSGDILVTTMTSPDFVIGMKKAGAIITDTGGMLSHAAIVSRELKIPCIVGTEIATKVIREGDVVELHCGRGTVKIVKHKVRDA